MQLEETRYLNRPSYRQQTAHSTFRVLSLVLVAALATFAIGGVLTAFDLAAQASCADEPTARDVLLDDADPLSNASTPANQWKRGTTPCLYQRDPAWENEAYAGETIGTSGCGPTCLAMVYIALTGNRDITPVELCAFSERNGFVEDGMTRWALLEEGAAALGLSSRIVPVTADSVRTELKAGRPLILSLMPGDFTQVGHFIVACGLDDAGRLIIRDPNSPERTHQPWEISRVLEQAKCIWSFTAI